VPTAAGHATALEATKSTITRYSWSWLKNKASGAVSSLSTPLLDTADAAAVMLMRGEQNYEILVFLKPQRYPLQQDTV
jgi:hypothetical protein